MSRLLSRVFCRPFLRSSKPQKVSLFLLTALLLCNSPQCNAQDKIAREGTSASQATHFGIMYFLWHCLATGNGRSPSYISKAISGESPWGPIPSFHYWGEPAAGSYCLTERRDVLEQHALTLHNAGIDFIVIDASNNEFLPPRTPHSKISIMDPFDALLRAWSTLPYAPKIVVWAPLTSDGTMLDWLLSRTENYPHLRFLYRGSPLVLLVDNRTYKVDLTREAVLSSRYTVRRMWAFVTKGDKWSFLQPCRDEFRASEGFGTCDQSIATLDGNPEQVSIAVAYQRTYMSNKTTAVPKFSGRTFARQFVALQRSHAPIAIITGWNEWIGQRFCLNADNSRISTKDCNPNNDHWQSGEKIFVDTYDSEYNRDIEPSREGAGDFYLRLMQHCIREYRADRPCLESDIAQ